jgi:hypothetical protein
MLIMDLLPKKKIRKFWAPLSFIVLGGLVALALFYLPRPSATNEALEGLRGEDQQVLIAVLDRLDLKFPQFHREIREVEETLIRNPEVASLSTEDQSLLASVLDHRLVFSNSFFKSDSVSQEQSLIDVITTIHPEMNGAGALAKKSGIFTRTGENPE